MIKKYQVFVSSTYEDLIEERKEVTQALLETNCFPAGMELFPASNGKQWEIIKTVIDDSDFYLLIIGGRYGSTTLNKNKKLVSYTEMEFDYAAEKGKPIIAFLIKEPEKLPRNKTEETKKGWNKLKQFRKKVQSDRMIKYWTNKGDLKSAVINGISELKKEKPDGGWIKNSDYIYSSNLNTNNIEKLSRLCAEGETAAFVVSFDTNGYGTTPEAQIVANGNTANSVKPQSDSYTFEGWFRERECINAFDFSDPIKNDVKLYAKWIQAKNSPFEDVKEGQYFFEPVLWALNRSPQIIQLADSTFFHPEQDCTRGQMMVFLWRAKGCPEPKRKSQPFTDVNPEAFYYKAMLWAVENNIVDSVEVTRFNHNSICTREQVVSFLWRICGSPEPSETKERFNDVKSTAAYFKAVLWAAEKHITNGTSKDFFSPNNRCTKGQAVTFLYRALGTK